MHHTTLTHSHDLLLVVLSFITAMLASYTALDLAGRVAFASARTKWAWLAGGALALGLGIWAMHFIGMLAFHLDIPISYHWPTVVVSLLAAVLASAIALFIVSRPTMGWLPLIGGGLVMGFAIAGMHYIGMAAIRLQAVLTYDSPLYILSVVIAIVASMAALWLAFRFRSVTSRLEFWLKIASAVVMGFAIAGMHYTGMAAVILTPNPDLHPDLRFAVKAATLIQIAGPLLAGGLILAYGVIIISQFRNYSLRVKLITSFTLVSVLAVVAVGFTVNRLVQSELTAEVDQELSGATRVTALAVGDELDKQVNELSAFALNATLRDGLEEASAASTGDLSELERLDRQWRAADAAGNNAHHLVQSVLNHPITKDLHELQEAFPEKAEIFVTDQYGANVASIDRTSDYYQADEEWWQAVYNDGKGGVFIGQPEFDESSQIVGLQIAVPVYGHQANEVVGVLRTTLDMKFFEDILIAARFGKSGHVHISLPDGTEIHLQAEPEQLLKIAPAQLNVEELVQSATPSLEVQLTSGAQHIASQSLVTARSTDGLLETEAIAGLEWRVVAHQERAEAFQAVTNVARTTQLAGLGALLMAGLLAVLVSQFLTGPIIRLTQAADKVSSGDLKARAHIESRDEIGVLAATFNSMTAQLSETLEGLEQRVADRTHDMELASEVGRAISEKAGNLTEMLTEAAETIRSRFDLYYTQVYLVDPSGRNLVLRAGTGDAGSQLVRRGHRLAISSASLNGRAALDRHAVIMGDTQQSSNFRHNPLLPLTRSELAIPLIANNKVVGVLDMQNEKPETFSEANLSAFQVLAGQLAIAIQNSALFKEAEESRLVVEEQAARLTGSGWRQFLNAVDRSENIGYVFSQDVVLPWVEAESPVFENTLTVPIEITGSTVGEVQLADGTNRKWSTAETEIVEAAVSRVGQHIENLRLFGQAEKYRSEAEQVSRRLTSEGWNEYLQTRKELADGYSYNLDKVQPLDGIGHNESVPALSYPLMIRDESIGMVLVDSKDSTESHTSEVISAVVEQLSGHIENLRLLEQAEQRRLELETVAAVSSTVSTVLDPDKLLQTVVDMTKERFGLYHAHIYLADQNWNTLLLASGAGEVGRKMVAEEHSISMDAEKSLVARALRERQSIIANDVRSQPDFLPNPLLPETRAEMAVPMIVSDKVIGVFDVQSASMNGFSKEDAAIYTTLASQVAIALQNARLYVEQAATVTQLRELDRLKSSFLANMSHELRTPLNSILGFTDVMLEGLDGQLTDYMDNDLRLIQKNGQHLMHLINDVLDMAKIESGHMNLNPETFKVHSVLDDVTSITSTLASEKNLSLFIDENSDQDIEIYADNTRLRQVMINLVNNSIKFTETGRISLCVTPMAGARVLISVKDTGIGIPPEKLEAVFLEFTQVDSSTTRKVGGTGLGLPISRRLVEMHGGRVWAESTGVEGEGSTFYVELPIEARMTEVVEKQEK